MDREKLRDKVKKDIRALLISAPLGVPAHIFAKDYRQMNGKEVPYREIGHRSLDDFILSIPDVVRVGTGPTGLVTFYPVATKETQHIVNMIRKQKKPSVRKAVIPTAITARKTPVKMSSFSRRGGFGSRHTPRGGGGGYRRPQGILLPLPSPPPSVPVFYPPLPSLSSHPPSSHPPSSRLGPNCLSQPDHRLCHPAHLHTAHHSHPPNSHTSLHHQSHPSHRHILTNENPCKYVRLHQYHPAHLIVNAHVPHSHPHPSHHHPITHSHPLTHHPPLLQTHSNPFPPATRPALLCHRSRTPPPPFPRYHSPPYSSPHLPRSRPPPLFVCPNTHFHHPHTQSCPSFCTCTLCCASSIFPWISTPSGVTVHHSSPEGKYHPRAFGQPWTMYVPSRPPRMQQRSSHQSFSHQSFSHSSSSSSWSSLPAAGPLYPHPTSSAPSTQSHGATRSRLGSKPEGAAVRPRLASLPENSTNRLHPQHTLASFSSSNKVASPTTNSNNLSNLWREEYKRAQHMTIEEMNGLTRSNPKPQFQNPVCVEGITGSQKEGVFMQKAVIKILLRASTYRKGKPDFPPEAVLLHFMAPFWDLRSYSQPYDLREGVKLRVYGTAFAPYSKQKNKSEPSIRVAYYELVDSSSGSTSSSSQSSPRESRSNTPKVETKPSDQSSLEDNIFKLLLKFDKGIYAKRLSKVYQTEFKVAPPENILELARAMPFVMIESITATDAIMYMKEVYRKKADQRESQPPSSQPVKPPVVEYLPPPPPLPSTASFTENRLYEVLVCFVTSPFSFYVQIRDDAEQQFMFTEMEKQMNKYFQSSPKKREVVLVKENQLYASLWGDGTEGQWCRAMVISVQDSKANVLFPDYGNQEFVSISDLRKLPLQFYQLPLQAIQCCLHGVLMNDNMMSPEANDYFAELAADKVCALHVMDSTGARVSVEILDKQLDDDENINSKLITRFHPIASLSPKLPSPGEPMVAVKLTDVDEVGVLSIQVVGPGLSQLEELTKQIEEKCSTKQTTKIAVGGMYCTEYSLDLCWYRVRVVKEMSSREVLVEYVDYGNEEIIDRMKLRPALDTELFCLPPQIVKCKLHGVPPQEGSWTDSATNYLAQYIDIDELNLRVVDYCIKVTGASSLTLPVVKLYVKNSAHEMVCVNDTVLQEPRLFGLPESLPRPPVDFKTRTSRSVSSAVGSTEEEVVGQRSKTGSSLPSTPREILTLEIASEAGSDTVFGGHLPVDKQQLMSRASSTANSSTRSSPFHALALQARTSYESPSRSDTVSVNSAQIRDENIETLSISSLEDTSRDATEFKASVSDDGKVSPGRPSSAHAKINQHSPTIDMTRLSLVDSPKECIKDGVPYVASPVPGMTVQSCHLAAPSSATRTSPPSSTSLSPSYTKSPSPGPSPAVSSPPITPPMSPPPDPISKCTQTTPSVHGSWVEGERCKWEELPSGKLVEVEVTWAPSPSNFTLLLISNKPKLKLMSEELQRLVAAERYLSPQSSCSGHVCAAKYSMDGLWYRAIISQPFQPHSMQTPVDFLDYGGSELVPLSGLKCLPERCRYLPFQAIKASLYGIGGDVLSPIIVKRFEEMVLMKRLFAIKRTSDSSARVSVMLLDTSDSSGQDIVINEVLSQYILMTK